jgi:hypothetical protein
VQDDLYSIFEPADVCLIVYHVSEIRQVAAAVGKLFGQTSENNEKAKST